MDHNLDIPVEYPIKKSDDLANNRLTIYGVAIGKDTGHFIISTYSQIYAVFISATPIFLSIITSMRNFIQLAVQLPFGRLSDKYGRKPFLVSGLFLAAVLSFIFPTITDPVVFLIVMIGYSLCYSVFAPSWIALLGDSSEVQNRGSYIGKITTISVMFTMTVFLITGWIVPFIAADFTQQYQIIYSLGGIGFLIAGFFCLISLKETNPHENRFKSSPSTLKDQFVRIISPLRENPNFRRFVIISAFMDFSMSTGWPIFGFIRERYATPSEYSFLWATHMACQIFSLYVGGKLIDKYGKKIGFNGRKVMFLIPLVLFLARNWVELAIANFIGGIGYGLYFVTTTAYIIDSAPEDSKGKYVGVYQLVMGLATFVGSFSMGIVTELLIPTLGKWNAIYTMVIIVIFLRFFGGMAFYFVDEPQKTQSKVKIIG
ncbi:MAG: MFS transporter [Candidatus Hodarchaeales archaeon]|jgi:MFS family permease